VFIEVLSIGFWFGKTAFNSGNKGPLKNFSATVVKIVGTSNALAKPVHYFLILPQNVNELRMSFVVDSQSILTSGFKGLIIILLVLLHVLDQQWLM